MKLTRRYKRFKYKISWKYPALYVCFRIFSFPVQVAALGLVLFVTVSFLLDSFQPGGVVNASAQQSNSNKAKKSLKKIPTITKVTELADETESAEKLASRQTQLNLGSKVSVTKPRLKRQPTESQLSDTLTSEPQQSVVQPKEPKLAVASAVEPVVEPASKPVVEPAGIPVAIPVTIREPKVTSADAKPDRKNTKVEEASLPANQAANQESKSNDQSAEHKTSGLNNENWINAQSSEMFVIQLVASPKYNALVELGLSLSGLDSVAIYPYRANVNGRTVYGISTGLYRSAREASRAVEAFPDSLKEEKPWVRKIEELQSLISEL